MELCMLEDTYDAANEFIISMIREYRMYLNSDKSNYEYFPDRFLHYDSILNSVHERINLLIDWYSAPFNTDKDALEAIPQLAKLHEQIDVLYGLSELLQGLDRILFQNPQKNIYNEIYRGALKAGTRHFMECNITLFEELCIIVFGSVSECMKDISFKFKVICPL